MSECRRRQAIWILAPTCLAALAACQTSADPPGPSTLEFRKVLTTAPGGSLSGSSAPRSPADVANTKAARQNIEVSDQTATKAALTAHQCMAPDPLRGQDDPALPLVTCDRDGRTKYVLEPALLTAADVETASARFESMGLGYVVDITSPARDREPGATSPCGTLNNKSRLCSTPSSSRHQRSERPFSAEPRQSAAAVPTGLPERRPKTLRPESGAVDW